MIGFMCNNGPPGNYCGVLKEHLIAHVLTKQNGGSTNMPLFDKDHECKSASGNTSND